jgi:hypothetical protein
MDEVSDVSFSGLASFLLPRAVWSSSSSWLEDLLCEDSALEIVMIVSLSKDRNTREFAAALPPAVYCGAGWQADKEPLTNRD